MQLRLLAVCVLRGWAFWNVTSSHGFRTFWSMSLIRSALLFAMSVAATATTTTAMTTDGGGWPWWAWFLLALGIGCCLNVCCLLLFHFPFFKYVHRKKEPAHTVLPAASVQTPIMTTVPATGVRHGVPRTTATMPFASSAVPMVARDPRVF